MFFRKILPVLSVLFLLVEPIFSAVPTVPVRHQASCSTCGMKGTCGVVCCCHPHSHQDMTPSRAPRLFPMGCHQDKDSIAFNPSNTPRWTPETLRLSPPRSVSTFVSTSTNSLPDPSQEILTPPPNLGFLP